MKIKQDYFISHANEDKSIYIQPLAECLIERGVTFWLDSLDISWGDSLALKVNEGLSESRYIILCLSKAFLARPWPEAELNAAFTLQTNTRQKKVLPLILNSKERILQRYPLIAGLVYREYAEDPQKIADALAKLAKKRTVPDGFIHVMIESTHTGHLSNLVVSPRASVSWLAEQAKQAAGLKDYLDTGGPQFPVRWVLVDANADTGWEAVLEAVNYRIERMLAIVKTDDGIKFSMLFDQHRLEDIGVYNDIVFHLYAVPVNPRGGIRYSI